MTGNVQGAQIDTSSVGWPTVSGGDQSGAKTAEPTYAYATVNNPVIGKTYTLTVQIHVPNSSSTMRTFKPMVYAGAGFHVNVDAGTPPADGPSTTVRDDLLGGTFTFSFGAPIHWTHNLWRQQALNFDGLWSGVPVAHVGVYRITHVTPDASVDSIDALQPSTATLTWSAYLWNYGSDVIPVPAIALDGSSQTFVPPVMFPLSVTGADLQHYDALWLNNVDGYTGHSHADVAGAKTGFDVSRTMSPQTIPVGGGTQTVTVSATLRDPQTAANGLSIDIIPGELVTGAVIDAASVVPPMTDPSSGAYTYVAPDGSDAYWSLSAPALNTTYTLTLQIRVPDGAGTALRYKPSVTVEVAGPATHLPPEWGHATTIPDAVLGGTFAFTAGADVDWALRSQMTYTDAVLAPLAATADTTPPVLSVPADKVVDAVGSAGATVSYTVDCDRQRRCEPGGGLRACVGERVPARLHDSGLHRDRRGGKQGDRVVHRQGPRHRQRR